MKKKGKQAARLPKRVAQSRMAAPKIGVSAEPASPSSAWVEMMAAAAEQGPVDTRRLDAPRVNRREAGPGLDLLPRGGDYVDVAGESPAAPVWDVVDGVCTGCIEKITQPKDHPWWCPWWDTPAGKVAHPL